MTKLTRREMAASLGVATIFGGLGDGDCEDCDEEEEDSAQVKATGSLGSRVLSTIIKYDRQQRSQQMGQPLTNTAAPSSSAGGVLPPSARSTSSRTASTPLVRAFYLLDILGDAQTDGRVLALLANETTLQNRGQVTLRPLMPAGPSYQAPHMELTRDGGLLIVSQSSPPAQWILIDAGSLTISGRLMAPPGVFPRRCAFSPDGRRAYAVVANQQFDMFPQSMSIRVLDTVSRTIIGAINLPANTIITDLEISPDGGLLCGVGGAILNFIDVATGTYSGSVAAVPPAGDTTAWSGQVERMAIHPNGEELYVGITRNPSNNFNLRSGAIGVFDLRRAEKIAEIPLRYPSGVIGLRIGISPSGKTLFAGFQRGTEIQILDTATRSEVSRIPLEASFGFADLAVA